jgi:hypothetical protein
MLPDIFSEIPHKFSHLKLSGNYIYFKGFCILPTRCIHTFTMILTLNDDCFLKLHRPVNVCNEDEVYWL